MASVHESELELELEPALHEAESEGEGARLTGQIDTFGDSLYSRRRQLRRFRGAYAADLGPWPALSGSVAVIQTTETHLSRNTAQ
jgi:hypothetical protein